MSMKSSRDVAADFENIFKKLPAGILIEARSHFQASLNKKGISKGDETILKSFNDEINKRGKNNECRRL